MLRIVILLSELEEPLNFHHLSLGTCLYLIGRYSIPVAVIGCCMLGSKEYEIKCEKLNGKLFISGMLVSLLVWGVGSTAGLL